MLSIVRNVMQTQSARDKDAWNYTGHLEQQEVLLQDAHHWRAEDGGIIVGYWDLVTEVDFRKNSFSHIHESIQLLQNLERLNLSHNLIESIQNLQWLSQLTYLDLSHNKIRHLDSLHTKLGNLKCLLISHNCLENLHEISLAPSTGFAKLFSLQTLDISHNSIAKIEELWFVSQLPCIEDLIVTGNAVTNSLDYRTKTLEMFGDRVREVVLDKQPSDQKELDTVAVLQALRKAKNVKIAKKSFQQKNASVLSLSDMCGDSTDTAEGRSSQAASPIPGTVSRSVPLNGAEWLRREHGPGQRSASPLSQVSIKSFNSMQDETQGLPLAAAGTSPGVGLAGQTDKLAMSPNTTALPDALSVLSDNEFDLEPEEFEQVPEAHPFDLNFDNLAGAASSSGAQAGPSEEVKKGGNFLSTTPTLLNKLRKPGSSPSLATSPSATGGSAGSELDLHQGRDTPSSQMRTLRTAINSVADLPGMSDKEFVSWLEGELLPERGSLPTQAAHTSGQGGDSIVDIFWCYSEQLSRPGHLFPCCVIVTRDKVVLERLVSPVERDSATNQAGTPRLKLCTIVPICNIQQLVLGPCHAFLRLEEAFVGKPGTYTMFGLEPHGLKRLVGCMLEVCESLDVSNTPDFINLSVQSDLLKEIIAWEERNLSMASDRLAVAILVKELGACRFSFLVLSENQVYCLDTAFVHWPPASFETSPDMSITFNILHNFSITDKISNITNYPLPSADTAAQCLSLSDTSVPTDPDIQFLLYQLDLQVKLGSLPAERSASPMQLRSLGGAARPDSHQLQAGDSSSVSYLFFSAAHRDLFLDRLTNLRAERAHSMVPSVREEPEGGNELQPQAGTCVIGSQLTASQVTRVKHQTKLPEELLSCTEEDAGSTGSAQTAASEDNTVYYSASPSENLSVSPMSNFSRASISPPTTSQQVGGKQNVISHVVLVEATPPATGQIQEVHVSPSQSDQGLAHKSQDVTFTSGLVTSEVVVGLKPSNRNANSIPSNLSDRGDGPDFNVAFEHLKRPDTEPADQGEESELDQHLRRCIRSYNLLTPLPVKLKPLYLMGGRELREFFKMIMAEHRDTSVDDQGDMSQCYRKGSKDEELRHVLWTNVVPYTNPKHEIVTLVMISTGGIYLVSDTSPSISHKSRPSWMTHTRNQSDSAFAWKSSSKASVPANITQMFSPPRIPTDFTISRGEGGAASSAVVNYSSKAVKPYFRFQYEDVHQIDVGVFDQCVRLTGSSADSVFTLAVRGSAATEQLIQYLKDMLTLFYTSTASPTEQGDNSDAYLLSSWEADDFYREDSQRTKSTLEGIVYTHPSQVKFVYPGEDAIKDILYLVDQSSRPPGKPQRKASMSSPAGAPPSSSRQRSQSNSSLWLFILCHQLLGQPQEDQMPPSQARSVIITPTHFSLSQEDIVTYPLPDFVRGLPENPCHQITECRPIEALKRIRLYRCNPHWVALTFVDEAEDFVVDTSIEHFSPALSTKERQGLSPEVTIYLFIESPHEKDKLVQLLGKIWKQLITQVGRILDVAHV
ncbi:nischarin [Elysia marginata]|uniref:Nischarin n=1 Tax=Elysia marginata TaxID=1093978 RepID=A0AAV4IAB2_9GAST|nr:nischarin [Elysia marginata]